MACGCGTLYTDEEIDAWITNSGVSDSLMEAVKENPRAAQTSTGAELLDLLSYSIASHIRFLSNDDARAANLVKAHVERLVEKHIQDELAQATPFEPIIIKQGEKVHGR